MLLLVCVLVSLVICDGRWKKATEDNGANGVIQKVHIIYRHGHKEPRELYPTDPNKEIKIWYNGPGQLTDLGKQQGLRLGENIRARYFALLPKDQAWKRVKAASSKSDRTLLTSSAVLAGLLLQTSEDYWVDTSSEHSVIHVSDILGSSIQCPRFNQALKKLQTACTNKHLCQTVSRYSGKKIKTITAMNNLYTTLEIERQAKLQIPKWAVKLYPKIKMEALKDVQKTLKDLALVRLRIGPLIERMLVFEGKKEPKISLYCTHENVLGPLLGIFNVTVNKPPDFASALLIEHRQDIHGQDQIQIWFSIGDDRAPERVSLPWCGQSCRVSRLQEVMARLVPSNWTRECLRDEGSGVDWGSTSGYVFAAMSFLVIVSLCVRSVRSTTGYQNLE